MYSYTWTKSDKDLELWDEFLGSTKRGHYLQLSHWLKAYTSYGFNFDLLLVRVNNEIVGGLGMVISGFLFFRFCSCACGPIIKEDHEIIFDSIIKEFKNRVKKYRPICSAINLPILLDKNENIEPYCLNIDINEKLFSESYVGRKIKSVISINGFREVRISYDSGKNPEDELFKGFSKNNKRNVKKALNNNLTIEFAEADEDVKQAYSIIELNAKKGGYGVRSWEDFGETILGMIKSQTAIMPVCKSGNILKGALLVFHTGERFSYISGGTVRETPDLKIGHFLHYNMLKLSIEKGYSFYDISVGGSPGVTRFKEGFGGKHVPFVDERYWIHNKTLFLIYSKMLPSLLKYKKFFARIIKYLK